MLGMEQKLNLYRGTQQDCQVKVTELLLLNDKVLNFLKECIKMNENLFWLKEMIYEDDMTFFNDEINYLLGNFKSVIILTSNHSVINDINQIINFLQKAFDAKEEVFVWEN